MWTKISLRRAPLKEMPFDLQLRSPLILVGTYVIHIRQDLKACDGTGKLSGVFLAVPFSLFLVSQSVPKW